MFVTLVCEICSNSVNTQSIHRDKYMRENFVSWNDHVEDNEKCKSIYRETYFA